MCFALRLEEGVENSLLFLGLVGVASNDVSVCCRDGILVVVIVGSSSSFSSSAIDDGIGKSADGGVESVVEAGSSGGASVISIPSGDPPNP